MTLPPLGYRFLPRVALEITLFWSNEGENFTSLKVTIWCGTHQDQWQVYVSSVLYMCRDWGKGNCICPLQSCVLIHTWCTMELTLAINMGYDILKIYKVLHWPSKKQINSSTGRGGLFTEYINMFLYIKTQASGYPDSVCTLKQKQEYVEEYACNQGVILDPQLIEHNPGLCSIAKLALNSFYGKFGQHSNMSKMAYITHYEKLYGFLTDQTKVIKDFHILDMGTIVMEYVQSEEFWEQNCKTNIIIASMCSAYAHLKLWKIMNRLGRRVMYHDMDSVIYTSYPEQWKPPIDKYLGDLANELSCHHVRCPGCSMGHWIVEFVSCSAKTYACRLNTGEVMCKVRGFSLNFSALWVVNLNSMKEALNMWKDVNAYPKMVTLKNHDHAWQVDHHHLHMHDAQALWLFKDIHHHPNPSLAHRPLRMKPIIPFQGGSPMMIIGSTNCGKTYLINQLLTNDMFTQPVASILYCYGVYQEFFNTMTDNPSIACPIRFQEGLPTQEDIDNMYDKCFHIIILDDLMENIVKVQTCKSCSPSTAITKT